MDNKFERSLIAAGFGGQGLMVLGQLIAYSGMHEGRNVTWIPSYGPEMRGGTANCSVIVSSDQIGAPVVPEADYVVVMNQPSIVKFEPMVKSGGILFYNSDLVKLEKKREDIKIYGIPANTIAKELGNDRVANIVMLGALVAAGDIVKEESALEMLDEKLGGKKPEFIPMNRSAFQKGKENVKDNVQ
ncbi:MAG: 2-oxoacid:acceptor oxidoreductase family protein [Synergistaceae bacterium]|nr:2-oxoacid:acceptor oxidoreductase family protein [Synergistaceae bacterium]